jgi:hypothetical protein
VPRQTGPGRLDRRMGSVSSTYLYLRTGLERTRFREALDRFDLCVVLGDALGCQMWVVEARSHNNRDTLDCSGSHVVDVVRLRTTIACQPDDRWRNRLGMVAFPSASDKRDPAARCILKVPISGLVWPGFASRRVILLHLAKRACHQMKKRADDFQNCERRRRTSLKIVVQDA